MHFTKQDIMKVLNELNIIETKYIEVEWSHQSEGFSEAKRFWKTTYDTPINHIDWALEKFQEDFETLSLKWRDNEIVFSQSYGGHYNGKIYVDGLTKEQTNDLIKLKDDNKENAFNYIQLEQEEME